eukprot:2324227-Rhodomonas_salina.2
MENGSCDSKDASMRKEGTGGRYSLREMSLNSNPLSVSMPLALRQCGHDLSEKIVILGSSVTSDIGCGLFVVWWMRGWAAGSK